MTGACHEGVGRQSGEKGRRKVADKDDKKENLSREI